MANAEKWIERRPESGQTCVFSEREDLWRRDALLFDRVYAPMKKKGYHGDWIDQEWELPDIPFEVSFGSKQIDDEVKKYINYTAWAVGQGALPEELDLRFERKRTEEYFQNGVMATWCWSDEGLYLRRFDEGESIAYQGALNNLPIVAPEVSWDEVMAFRQDKEAVRKYRDLRLWLRDSFKAQSIEHATDLIGQKIDNYQWAIKKHGLRTVAGALTHICEWKQAGVLLSAAGVAGMLGGGVVAALASGLAVSASIGAWFLERRVDSSEILRGPDREIAILVDAHERFGL